MEEDKLEYRNVTDNQKGLIRLIPKPLKKEEFPGGSVYLDIYSYNVEIRTKEYRISVDLYKIEKTISIAEVMRKIRKIHKVNNTDIWIDINHFITLRGVGKVIGSCNLYHQGYKKFEAELSPDDMNPTVSTSDLEGVEWTDKSRFEFINLGKDPLEILVSRIID